MKQLVTFVFLIAFSIANHAQVEPKQSNTRPLNNINLNLLGDGALFAINYERLFVVKSNVMLSAKVGYGYYVDLCFVFCKDLVDYRTIPLHLTANIGTGRHFLEVGLGGTVTIGYSNHNIYPIIGYRLQPLITKRVNLRVFAHWPIKETFNNFDMRTTHFPLLGLSFGISI